MDVSAVAEEALGSDSDYVDLDALVLKGLQERDGVPELMALEQVDRYLPRVRHAIDRLLADRRSRDITASFGWDGPDKVRLIHIRHGNRGREVEAAIRRRDEIRGALADLSGRQFEHLCGLLLKIYGVPEDERMITPRGGEGGVDFIGRRSAWASRGTNRLERMPIRVFGQAKRHTGGIGTDEMDAFCLRLNEARQGVGRAFEGLPVWFQECGDPIIGLFVTSGRYGPAALRSAKQHTVFCLDGDQVAEDLATSRAATSWFVAGQFNLADFLKTFPS
jgi:hypothetical protein